MGVTGFVTFLHFSLQGNLFGSKSPVGEKITRYFTGIFKGSFTLWGFLFVDNRGILDKDL